MADFGDAIKLVGGVLGIFSFIWNVWSAWRSYLVLGIEVRTSDGAPPMVKVSITNSRFTSKKISYAALVVSPEGVTLGEAARLLVADKLSPRRHANALVTLANRQEDAVMRNAGCLLLPLRELYQDQAMVGPGETVTHACSVDLSSFPDNSVQIIRFIAFISYANLYIRWRYTAEALFVHNAGTAGCPVQAQADDMPCDRSDAGLSKQGP